MPYPVTDQPESIRYGEIASNQELSAAEAAVTLFKQYAREHPEVVALWTFGIGFVLGWKLKPW
ncbi:MAG: hypothetical protein GXX96_21410 [Planctomycetaceae bacterium]|jgi:hypothetical protein|nr:hypothetical protein [Planctomycetaceae bacterium]